VREIWFARVFFVFVGVLLIALAVPMIRGRVRPNRLYGLRTLETLGDEGIWYVANRRSGWDMVIVGAVLILWTGLAAWVYPAERAQRASLITVALMLALTLGAAWRGIRHGRELWRARHGERRPPPI
jgi:hypothetical protein